MLGHVLYWPNEGLLFREFFGVQICLGTVQGHVFLHANFSSEECFETNKRIEKNTKHLSYCKSQGLCVNSMKESGQSLFIPAFPDAILILICVRKIRTDPTCIERVVLVTLATYLVKTSKKKLKTCNIPPT